MSVTVQAKPGSVREQAARQSYPTIGGANLLYLVAMLLVVTAGAAIQARSPGWGLIVTEIVLILLPALAFMGLARLAPRETLRLRWPGWRAAGLSLLIGAGVWLFASWLGALMTVIMGYSVPVAPGFIPLTPGQALVTFAGLALCAPLCEEVLFRGIIQRAYARLSPVAAWLITTAMFAVFHLTFQGLPSLVPISLALGFVVWKTRSIVSGMLMHFANNFLAATLLTVAGMFPGTNLAVPSLPAALLGVVLAAVGLWALRRVTPPAVELEAPAPPVEAGHWLRRAWPLAVAALVVAFMALAEVVVGWFPQVLANDTLDLPPAPWTEPVRWTYDMRNPLGDTVGQTKCTLTPAADTVALVCQGQHSAFEARQGQSYYQAGEGSLRAEWTWRRSDLALVGGQLTSMVEGNAQPAVIISEGGARLEVTDGAEAGTLNLPPSAVVPMEWAWRLMAYPFSLGSGSRVTIAWPHKWDPALQSNPPALEESFVLVRGVEVLPGPDGPVEAWRVTVGDEQTAWYSVEAPHTLLRYDDGMWSYVLTDTASP